MKYASSFKLRLQSYDRETNPLTTSPGYNRLSGWKTKQRLSVGNDEGGFGEIENVKIMLIEINIDCEDETEMLAHLSVIRKQIKREMRKYRDAIISNPVTLEDSNCYGDHTVNIIPDCSEDSGHFPDGNGFCLSCGHQLPDYVEN